MSQFKISDVVYNQQGKMKAICKFFVRLILNVTSKLCISGYDDFIGTTNSMISLTSDMVQSSNLIAFNPKNIKEVLIIL